MGYFSVTAFGTGVSGNTLPHTGTITFTVRFAETNKDAPTYNKSLNITDSVILSSVTANVVYEEVFME